jgi:hypothetical protein
MNSYYGKAGFYNFFLSMQKRDSPERTIQWNETANRLNKFVHLLEVFPRTAIR